MNRPSTLETWHRASLFASLRHPLFLAALVVLATNDHVLKPLGAAPAWFTGKASDFAGLLVAPLVVVLALAVAFVPKARLRRSWTAAHVAIAVLFGCIKLAPACSALVADALSLFVASRIVCDPTDLVALRKQMFRNALPRGGMVFADAFGSAFALDARTGKLRWGYDGAREEPIRVVP